LNQARIRVFTNPFRYSELLVLGLVKTQAVAPPKTTPFFCAFASKYTFEPSPDSCLHESISLFGIAGVGACEDTSRGASQNNSIFLRLRREI
jgi:hypothetical protein